MSKESASPRDQLRLEISQLPKIFDGDPSGWWFKSYRYLRREFQKLPNQPDEIKSSLGPFLKMAIDLVEKETKKTPTDDDRLIAQDAESVIMKLSFEMAKRFEPEIVNVNEHIISPEELVSGWPDSFDIRKNEFGGKKFGIRNPVSKEVYYVNLPSNNFIWYKGGVSRVVLNIVAGAKVGMILSDLPPNDHDGVAVGSEHKAHKDAVIMGIDADGLEMYKGNKLDFTRFCLGRDSTQNQVIFGSDGLHFSPEAFETARTGHTDIVGEYIPEKAIYGVDRVFVNGNELVKPRGQMRLIKGLSEGKIESFYHKPLSSSLDVGLYVMFLAKRWSKKENFPILMQRMFEVLNRMGQVREGEKTIFDTLRRAHKDYPFFDFSREIKDIVEVVGWKSRKLVKQIDREFAWNFPEGSGLKLSRKKGDIIPQLITLEDFNPSSIDVGAMMEEWNIFLAEARKEYEDYQKLELTPVQRMFRKADLVDMEDLSIDGNSGMFFEGEEEI